MPNLRILYNNISSTATISSGNEAVNFPPSNTKLDTKGSVWRSLTSSTFLQLFWNQVQSIQCVVLPFNNLSSAATIRVRVYSDLAGNTLEFDSGVLQANKTSPERWGPTESGVNTYSYGGGNYTTVWTPLITNATRVLIDLVDTGNPQGYLEVSRVLCGTYWSPAYNTEFGVEVGYVDASSHDRSQSGNLLTDVGTLHKTLSFSLSYLTQMDKDKLMLILRHTGKRLPLFVSLFPESTDEQAYEIYGKLSDSPTISHPMFTVYASSCTIEEM